MAEGGAGLLITGHIFVDPLSQCSPRQFALHDDRFVSGLRRRTRAVHRHGAAIFAELSHAVSQSMVQAGTPLAPSAIVNPIYQRHPEAAGEADVSHVVASFAAAAARSRPASTASICMAETAT